MFEFIILFSKTMKELKKRVGRSYGNLRVFLISFAYWWAKSLKTVQEMWSLVAQCTVIYCDDRKSVHLDAQEQCTLSLSHPLLPFRAFSSLSVKGSAVSHHFLQKLLQTLTLESKSAEELTDSLLWLQRLMPNPNLLLAQEGAINTEFLDRQNSFFKNADK